MISVDFPAPFTPRSAHVSPLCKVKESNPDIDVIFLDTDALLKGAYAAITEAGHTGKVGEEGHIGLYSVDGEGFVLDMIREGTCDGVYSQYPITLGADVGLLSA